MQTASERPEGNDERDGDRRVAATTLREARLRAALKANMARRKAQAKARSAEDARGEEEED
jgi:hypothetical protein